MTKQNGVGVITDKGQQILAYHAANGGAVTFKKFILSTLQEAVTTIVNDTSTYNGKTEAQLLATLGGSVPAGGTGNVTSGGAVSGTTIPLLCTIPVNNIATSTNLHAVFITATSPIPADSGADYVFSHHCFYYDDAGTPGVYADDGNTIAMTYEPGTSFLIPIDLEYTGGAPESVAFTDTAIIEIEQHNALVSSHDATHLRLDGNNSPLANIDWDSNRILNLSSPTAKTDGTNVGYLSTIAGETVNIANYTEWQAWVATLSLGVNHNVDVNLTTNHSSFQSNVLSLSNITGAGAIRISGFPTTVRGFDFTNMECKVQFLGDISVDGLTTGIGIETSNCKLVQIVAATGAIDFTNCTTIVSASRSKVVLDGNGTGISILTGNVNGFLADYNSTITLTDIRQTNPTFITGTLYQADHQSKIYKPSDMVGNLLVPRTTAGVFEKVSTGSRCIGAFDESAEVEEGGASATYTIYVEDSADIQALNNWLRTFGTYLPKNLTLNIDFEDDQVLGATREFDLTGYDPIRLDGFHGPGSVHIATENTDYLDMLIKSDDVIFDIRNCKSKIEFGDLTLQPDGTAASDYAISVFNCDNFEINTGSDVLVINSDVATGIKIDECRLVNIDNVDIDQSNLGTGDVAMEINKSALVNISDSNFSNKGKYIDAYYSRVAVVNCADVGATTSATKRFHASTGTSMQIGGTYEAGTGATVDIDGYIVTDITSMIICDKQSTGNSVITFNQKTVTLT